MDEEQVKADFERFDRDANGKIDLAEFTELMQSLDAGMNAAQTTRAFQIIDLDENGLIDFAEFHDWWTS